MKKGFLLICLGMLLISLISAQSDELDIQNQNRLNFGHVLLVKEIYTEPSTLIQGSPSLYKISLYNTGANSLRDIRAILSLPNEIAYYNDVSEERYPIVSPGGNFILNYNIVSLPKTSDGIYEGSLYISYVNQIGEIKEDNYSVSFIVKGEPKVFMQIESSELYQGNNLGEISVKFVNNDLADIRFLTVQLGESQDYEILSNSKDYIGDLDSDDFQTSTFKIKTKDKLNVINLPIKISYKDSLNQDYNKEETLVYILRTPKDVGINSNNTLLLSAIVLGVVFIILYYFYRKRKLRISLKI
ncbi:MAG: hypothetical protein WC867_04865 [Candidatus Pacearchaeota archaeon]|jgi:hypothetical protein